MDSNRRRKLCVLVPEGNCREADVFLEETGEQIDGVQTVIYRLSGDPSKTRVRIDMCPGKIDFYVGPEAREKELELDRKYAQLDNKCNLQRLGISRIH